MVADEPEWRDGLKYIKQLYSQGLIDPQAFTQKMSNCEHWATILIPLFWGPLRQGT